MKLLSPGVGTPQAAILVLVAAVVLSGCSTLSSLNPFGKSSPGEAARNTEAAQRVTNVAEGSGGFAAQSQYGYVRVEPIEAGAAPNDHPAGFTASQIRAVLALQKTGRDGTLLNDEELNEIAAPIAAALSKAGPREDLTFAVAGKHGFIGSFAGPRSVTSGRVFYKSGGLNIIFGEVRLQGTDALTASGFLQPSVLQQFPPGSRTHVSPTPDLLAEGGIAYGASNRRDWTIVAAGGIPLPLVVTRTAPAATPAAPVAATPGAAPAAAPAAITPEQDIERRLTTLKSLRDKGLITEQEYDDKRKEILKSL